MDITKENIKQIDSIGFFEFLRSTLWKAKLELIDDISKKEQPTDDLWTTMIDDILDLDEERENVDLRYERKKALNDLKGLRALIDFFNREHVIFGDSEKEKSFLEVKSNFKFLEHEDRRCPDDKDNDTVYGEYTIRFKINQRT